MRENASSRPHTPLRIGIYAGAFDPVHVGHVGFALKARQASNLDRVYFMPERHPRYKHGITHYGHRVAMLKRVCLPHARLRVLETVERYFEVRRTLSSLHQQFPGAQLVFLMGSDVVSSMSTWPHIEQLVEEAEFCVSLRENISAELVIVNLEKLGIPSTRRYILPSYAPMVSSTKIRNAIRGKRRIHGLFESVYRYARKEWLYL